MTWKMRSFLRISSISHWIIHENLIVWLVLIESRCVVEILILKWKHIFPFELCIEDPSLVIIVLLKDKVLIFKSLAHILVLYLFYYIFKLILVYLCATLCRSHQRWLILWRALEQASSTAHFFISDKLEAIYTFCLLYGLVIKTRGRGQ